jgi:hypothetical protein
LVARGSKSATSSGVRVREDLLVDALDRHRPAHVRRLEAPQALLAVVELAFGDVDALVVDLVSCADARGIRGFLDEALRLREGVRGLHRLLRLLLARQGPRDDRLPGIRLAFGRRRSGRRNRLLGRKEVGGGQEDQRENERWEAGIHGHIRRDGKSPE